MRYKYIITINGVKYYPSNLTYLYSNVRQINTIIKKFDGVTEMHIYTHLDDTILELLIDVKYIETINGNTILEYVTYPDVNIITNNVKQILSRHKEIKRILK